MKSLEVIVRADITVKSSIKNLRLKDASTVVSCQTGGCGGRVGDSPPPSSLQLSSSLFLRSR